MDMGYVVYIVASLMISAFMSSNHTFHSFL